MPFQLETLLGGGFKVRLTFHRVDMEEGKTWQCRDCSCDYLEAFDGAYSRRLPSISFASAGQNLGPAKSVLDSPEGAALLSKAQDNSLGNA